MKNLREKIINYFTGRDIFDEYFWSVQDTDKALKSGGKYLVLGIILPNIATATGIGLSIGYQNPEYLSLSAGSEFFRNTYRFMKKNNIADIKLDNKIKIYENGLKSIEFFEEKSYELKRILKNKK